MSQAQLNEANIRLKRWLKAVEAVKGADGKPLVVNPGQPEVRTSALWPTSQRWRVYERLKWTLDGTKDGKIVDTECCVAAASSWGEAIMKYTMWVQDAGRTGFFADRHLRGGSQYRPPPDPPEWAEFRKQAIEAVQRADENTAEWVKKSTKAQMAHVGFDDPTKFALAWERAKAMGLVKA